MKKVIFLMGPTASGKTDLALQLVKKLPLEIISVDSGMVYRRMDIGTAKPTLEELAVAPHHLINIRDPEESYSAGDFRSDAMFTIEDIFRRGKIPLLVGGTMLYFRILEEGISHLPQADEAIRRSILNKAKQYGWEEMHRKLSQLDPQLASKISINDSQRIQRALEVYEITGLTMSELRAKHAPESFPYPILKIGLIPPDKIWMQIRVQDRLKKMLQMGLLSEVEVLFNDPLLHKDLPSMRAVGYRQVWQFLEGTINYDEMLTQVIINTRQLAKRQLTWMNSWPSLLKFNASQQQLLVKTLSAIDKFCSNET